MKIFTVIIASTLLFFNTSQAQWKSTIKGDGNVITEKRDIEPYTSIVIHTNVDVSLIKGKEGVVTLKGEKNILEHLELAVKNNVLNIRTKKNVSLKPSLKNQIAIEIPITTVVKLEVNGSGEIKGKDPIKGDEVKLIVNGSGDLNITLDANAVKAFVSGSGDLKAILHAKTIKASLSGSGDIKLSGEATALNAAVTGSGDIDSRTLQVRNGVAKVVGSGDVYITASEQLSATIVGSGDIHINGDVGKIEKKIVGSGSINKR